MENIFVRLNYYLWRIACETRQEIQKKFNIQGLKSFKPMAQHDECAKNSLGYCSDDGHIRIQLCNPSTGKQVRWETIINTVCHELAHLTYQHHKTNWYRLYRKYFKYIMEKL